MSKPEKFGTQTTKGVVILAFRNGDKHHTGEKIVLHPTKQKTFDQVLSLMTNTVKIPTGSVRKVYTPFGRPVKELSDFHDKGRYICCGAEKLNKEQMPFVLQEALARAKAKKEQAEGNAETKAEEPIESNETEPTSEKEAPKTDTPAQEKFGVQTEKGKIIKVYRNGDKHHEGDRFVVHPRKYKTLEQLYADITTKVGVVTGPVRKLVYLKEDGSCKVVSSFDDILDKTKILACGPAAPKVDLVHPSYFARVGGGKEKLKAPVDQGGSELVRKETKHERFGTKTEKGKVIYVFRNGDKHDAGTRIVIHEKKYKRMDQVHTEMNTKVGVVTGAVRKVYLPTGKPIKSLDEFEDGCVYICSGAEALKKDLLSDALVKRYKAWRAKKKEQEEAGETTE
mmetsp:Transcript_125051/g.186779  ORF Transcript_125051/g.186779 Transcript_125051/m.186779 type:complete len:395 (-) Transcript_125051:76-1260(-)